MTYSEQVRAVLVGAVNIPKSDDFRTQRDASVNMPWNSVPGAAFFAYGKLSRCVIGDESESLNIELRSAMREIPDVLVYLCRMYGLATNKEPDKQLDPYNLQPLAFLAIETADPPLVVNLRHKCTPSDLITNVFKFLRTHIRELSMDKMNYERMRAIGMPTAVAYLARALWMLRHERDLVRPTLPNLPPQRQPFQRQPCTVISFSDKEDKKVDAELIAAGFDPEKLEKKGEQLAKRLLKERNEDTQS